MDKFTSIEHFCADEGFDDRTLTPDSMMALIEAGYTQEEIFSHFGEFAQADVTICELYSMTENLYGMSEESAKQAEVVSEPEPVEPKPEALAFSPSTVGAVLLPYEYACFIQMALEHFNEQVDKEMKNIDTKSATRVMVRSATTDLENIMNFLDSQINAIEVDDDFVQFSQQIRSALDGLFLARHIKKSDEQ